MACREVVRNLTRRGLITIHNTNDCTFVSVSDGEAHEETDDSSCLRWKGFLLFSKSAFDDPNADVRIPRIVCSKLI